MNHKFIDFFIALVLVGVTAMLFLGSNKSGADNNLSAAIKKINLFERKFSNLDACDEYVIRNAGNREKILLGQYSCAVMYGNSIEKQQGRAVSFYQCILNEFYNIADDNSGKRTVTKCAELSNEAYLGAHFSAFFDPAARIAKIIQEENEKRKQQSLFSFPGQLGSNALPIGDGIVNMNIDGHLKPCMKIGLEVSCD